MTGPAVYSVGPNSCLWLICSRSTSWSGNPNRELESSSPPHVAYRGNSIGHKEQEVVFILDVHVHISQPRHEVFALSLDDQGPPRYIHVLAIAEPFDDSIADDDGLVIQSALTIHGGDVHVHKRHQGACEVLQVGRFSG